MATDTRQNPEGFRCITFAFLYNNFLEFQPVHF
jgi:hypothetical protein